METLINDLAMILLVAGVTTLIFKKLQQPLVLGYIVAGFLTSPNFTYFPTIANKDNVMLWAEIGVIFLMFALGLEFSFYKLKKVGSSAFIATAVAVSGMIIIGYTAGSLLGWNHMNSLFLGGMLSMSSTAVIFKAFEDLSLKEEKFAGFVLGVLIIEDIAGIVMMVLLSTIATASANVSTAELFQGIAKLVFCLVLWFVLGMYLVPTFFKRFRSLFNDETLLVVSIGLCLGMVMIAEHAGFSAALGAFIMGSLIAEAPDSEKIEELVTPVKNLFSAVFFVSVGMLVNPTLLWQYIVPVVILILVTICGQITCATLGMLAAGQPLKTAMRSGFCLCQIGEFSFILAAMGTELGVTSNYLYPIIVAVSVITTFTTPFCMKLSEPVHKLVSKYLPKKFLRMLPQEGQEADATAENEWLALLKDYAMRLLIFGVLLIAIGLAANMYLLPYLTQDLALPYASYIGAGITLFIMGPILGMLIQNHGGSEHFTSLWYQSRFYHLPLRALIMGKLLIATVALYFIFNKLAGLHGSIVILLVAAAVYILSHSKWMVSQYLRLESRFLVNLNEKHTQKHATAKESGDSLSLDTQIYIASYNVLPASPLTSCKLMDLNFRQEYNCDIIRINTDTSAEIMPGGHTVIPTNSRITLIGQAHQLNTFSKAIKQRSLGLETRYETQTLRHYMLDDRMPEDFRLFVTAVPVKDCDSLKGKAIRNTDLRDKWNIMIIGLDRGDYGITNPDVNLVLEANDLLWLLGSPKDIQSFLDSINED